MLITYNTPLREISEIHSRLLSCKDISVSRQDTTTGHDPDFLARFNITHRNKNFDLVILQPEVDDRQEGLNCWLFFSKPFNPINPIAWMRWVAVDRKALRKTEHLLHEVIMLSKTLC